LPNRFERENMSRLRRLRSILPIVLRSHFAAASGGCTHRIAKPFLAGIVAVLLTSILAALPAAAGTASRRNRPRIGLVLNGGAEISKPRRRFMH
jgi:hypothetical protein